MIWSYAPTTYKYNDVDVILGFEVEGLAVYGWLPNDHFLSSSNMVIILKLHTIHIKKKKFQTILH